MQRYTYICMIQQVHIQHMYTEQRYTYICTIQQVHIQHMYTVQRYTCICTIQQVHIQHLYTVQRYTCICKMQQVHIQHLYTIHYLVGVGLSISLKLLCPLHLVCILRCNLVNVKQIYSTCIYIIYTQYNTYVQNTSGTHKSIYNTTCTWYLYNIYIHYIHIQSATSTQA